MVWYNNIPEWAGINKSHTDELDSPNMQWEKLRYLLTMKYGAPISAGLTRVVWKTKNGSVVKLCWPECHFSNEKEHWSAFEYKARTRLFYLYGFPLLFMEWVKEGMSSKIYDTWWVGFVDGGQVGYNRKGELVAFDLG